eukprot:g2863.t1
MDIPLRRIGTFLDEKDRKLLFILAFGRTKLSRVVPRAGPLAFRYAKTWGFDRDMLSIAPMMEVTDRPYRFFMRLLTKRTRLYTEMVVGDMLTRQTEERMVRKLYYDRVQHPIAVQLGGNDPEVTGKAAELSRRFGYDEVNLNCGCPSSRVSKGMFGAKLMLDPHRVRRICSEMIRRVGHDTPVTVKCRLGADDCDSYEELCNFIKVVATSGVHHFIVHARKCILSGLSTKQNRSIPPLRYDWLYRLKQDFPDLRISLNGGVKTLDHAAKILHVPTSVARTTSKETARGGGGGGAEISAKWDEASMFVDHDYRELDSVMLGRAAWHTPWIFADADRRMFGSKNPLSGQSRNDVVREYCSYVEDRISSDPDHLQIKPGTFAKPICNLYSGISGTAKFRAHMRTNMRNSHDFTAVVEEALGFLSKEAEEELVL